MAAERLRQLYDAWQQAHEDYRPGAVDSCARIDELCDAEEALFRAVSRATLALIECAEALPQLQDLAEWWIRQGLRPHMSESEYKTWHALGYGSKAMTNARQALIRLEDDTRDPSAGPP